MLQRASSVPRGAVAFAAPDGQVGVVSPEGAVDTLGELLCAKGIRAGVMGLTPFGNGAFAVTCDAGVVARITGSGGEAARPTPAPAPSSSVPDRPDRLRAPRD